MNKIIQHNESLYTTATVCEKLGISQRRLQAMLTPPHNRPRTKFLNAQKIGRDWAIPESDINLEIENRKNNPRVK